MYFCHGHSCNFNSFIVYPGLPSLQLCGLLGHWHHQSFLRLAVDVCLLHHTQHCYIPLTYCCHCCLQVIKNMRNIISKPSWFPLQNQYQRVCPANGREDENEFSEEKIVVREKTVARQYDDVAGLDGGLDPLRADVPGLSLRPQGHDHSPQ